MGKRPLALWTEHDGLSASPSRPLSGHWLDIFAQIAENLARLGISVASVNDCEIWEVAAMLGANHADDDEGPGVQMGDPSEFIPPDWRPPA